MRNIQNKLNSIFRINSKKNLTANTVKEEPKVLNHDFVGINLKKAYNTIEEIQFDNTKEFIMVRSYETPSGANARGYSETYKLLDHNATHRGEYIYLPKNIADNYVNIHSFFLDIFKLEPKVKIDLKKDTKGIEGSSHNTLTSKDAFGNYVRMVSPIIHNNKMSESEKKNELDIVFESLDTWHEKYIKSDKDFEKLENKLQKLQEKAQKHPSKKLLKKIKSINEEINKITAKHQEVKRNLNNVKAFTTGICEMIHNQDLPSAEQSTLFHLKYPSGNKTVESAPKMNLEPKNKKQKNIVYSNRDINQNNNITLIN